MFKNISFWCIVLFLVTAMVIHHIVSDISLIEGNENDINSNEDTGATDSKVNMKNVERIRIKMEGPGVLERVLGEAGAAGTLKEKKEAAGAGAGAGAGAPPECGDRGLVQKGAHLTDGCSRLENYPPTTREGVCNSSFEKSETGEFNNCTWDASDSKCSAETEECTPEMAHSNGKPYCSHSVWQPGQNLGITGTEENPSPPYCYCKDSDEGTNHTTGAGDAVSRCLIESGVTGGRLDAWMNKGRVPAS